jgi:predicted metal-binding membrane protein
MTTAALPLSYPRWRLLVWRHPESWVVLVSAGAWLLCISASAYPLGPMPLASRTLAGHAGHNPVFRSYFLDTWLSGALHWSIMIAAMMFPPLVGQLRFVAARSLWFRRNRAMALLLAGYSFLWLLYGFSADMSFELLRAVAPGALTFLVPFSFLVASFWQLTPQKGRSIVACHRTMPLAPSGRRADFDCCRYGFRTAASCCVSCWALMFACMATGHALWAMVVVTSVSWSERFFRSPRQRVFSLVLFSVALLTFLLVL